MPYQGINDGLYLVKQPSVKGIWHYGVLDVGNVLHHPEVDGLHPVVLHQTPPSLKVDWLCNTGTWQIIAVVHDMPGAVARIRMAWQDPYYNLFENNCEHFANYVTYGEKYSSQLQAAGTIAVVLTIFVWDMRRNA